MTADTDTDADPDSPRAGIITRTIAFLLTASSLAWAADLYRAVGLNLYTEQFLAGVLALSLALVFLAVPAHGREDAGRKVPWYDACCAVAGFAVMAYIAVTYPGLSARMIYLPADAIVLGAITLPLIIEGLRRTAGTALTLVVAGIVALALFASRLPGAIQGRPVDVDQLLVYLAMDPNALLGRVVLIAATVVVGFVFMGQLLLMSGGSAFFTDISAALMGRYRGGSAKIAVVASSLFGSISGSAVSNVATTGVVTIPLMRTAGYPAHQAAAIEAVASTGGQLTPPIMGAAAFLMAEFLQISYAEVVIAAIIPAILYYAAVFIQTDLEAAKADIAPVDASLIPRAARVIALGWVFPIPFAVLIGALFWFNLSPETSALYAAIALLPAGLFIGYGEHRLRPADLVTAMVRTGRSVLDIMMIGAAAGLIVGALNISGLSFGLTLALVQFGSGNLVLLLVLAAVICIVLGMGMPTVGVYVLLAALVAPALVEVGITPIAAHFFVFYFGMMSMLTPPVAIAAYAAATLAESEPTRTCFSAIKFGWAAYIVPFLFVASPSLLLQGSSPRVVLAVFTAIAGVWLISVGITGYLTRLLPTAVRVAFVAAGLLLMVPSKAFAGALVTDIAGFGLGIALVAWEWIGHRRARADGTAGARTET